MDVSAYPPPSPLDSILASPCTKWSKGTRLRAHPEIHPLSKRDQNVVFSDGQFLSQEEYLNKSINVLLE